MLKLNKNLNNGKTQLIGKFKLPFSLNGALENQPKWVDEKETAKVENLIGHLFTKYLREVGKRKVLYFSPNSKDDHKNPDLLIHLDGKVYGIQVTQFVLREYLSRFNQAKRICEKISGYITETYKPPIKINIQISTPWDSDEVPRAPAKKYKKLAKEIANKISENIEILKSKNEYLNFHLNKSEFGDIADDFNLYPVPKGNKSNFFGDNNIYIDYGFDDVLIFKEDIEDTADKVFKDKNNGNSEILIVWGDERQFMNTEKHIIQALTERFSETTFESIYFISFVNFLDIQDRVISVNKITTHNNAYN
ncbi:MAG: hypothetical protein P8P13_02880 [Flavobacteriaceae bacterium]|jgi:hypothetical protein|nr:hypothetical protein [Flavobacteriaceae bacterium]